MVSSRNLLSKVVQGTISVVAIAGFFLGGWLLAAWLYPDEWFTEIPMLILELMGFK